MGIQEGSARWQDRPGHGFPTTDEACVCCCTICHPWGLSPLNPSVRSRFKHQRCHELLHTAFKSCCFSFNLASFCTFCAKQVLLIYGLTALLSYFVCKCLEFDDLCVFSRLEVILAHDKSLILIFVKLTLLCITSNSLDDICLETSTLGCVHQFF